jgi:hypothetical protein
MNKNILNLLINRIIRYLNDKISEVARHIYSKEESKSPQKGGCRIIEYPFVPVDLDLLRHLSRLRKLNYELKSYERVMSDQLYSWQRNRHTKDAWTSKAQNNVRGWSTQGCPKCGETMRSILMLSHAIHKCPHKPKINPQKEFFFIGSDPEPHWEKD